MAFSLSFFPSARLSLLVRSLSTDHTESTPTSRIHQPPYTHLTALPSQRRAGHNDGLEPGQWSHCFCIAPGQRSNRFKCDECGLVSGKPEDSAVNAAIILKQTGGSTASGKSNKDDSAPAVPKLSAVDKELTRLAEEGEPFARFDDKEPVSAETALHEIRESWCGRIFAHPSAALVKYIQSGKLKEPGFAVPRALRQAARAARLVHAGAHGARDRRATRLGRGQPLPDDGAG